MDCLITSGIALGCRDNIGGIRRVLITNKGNVTAVVPEANSVGSPSDNGIITGITLANATYFYEFKPNKTSSNWVENIQANVQNGTSGFEQVVTLMFAKNEAAKRNQIKLLARGEVIIIVEDCNGKYWYIGETMGADLTGGSSQSGVAMADMNGWNLTFTAYEPDPAREVDADIIDALIAPEV